MAQEGRQKGQSQESRWEGEGWVAHRMRSWLGCLGVLTSFHEAGGSEVVFIQEMLNWGCCGATSSPGGQVWAGIRDLGVSSV